MSDLRCDGIRRSGPTAGQRCNYLLFRYSLHLDGTIETKCVSCNTVRLWTFQSALIGATT